MNNLLNYNLIELKQIELINVSGGELSEGSHYLLNKVGAFWKEFTTRITWHAAHGMGNLDS